MRAITIALVCILLAAGTEVSIQTDPGQIFPVYLLMTRPSSDTPISAWAAMILVPELRGDAETPHWLHGFPNGASEPMFAVNAEITPVSDSTWSGVKSMFD